MISRNVSRARRDPRVLVILGLAALIAAIIIPLWGSGGRADAAGGTAKPPPGAVAPWTTPTLATPNFAVNPALIHGFDVTGFYQDATVSADNTACPNTPADKPERFGGTVKVNNTVITVPCNMVIQMPANTFRWADFVNGVPPATVPSLTLGNGFPSFEIQVVGNTVAGQNIAALMYFSQQSLNSGSGVIQQIDYATGNIKVDSGDPANPAVLQINDPIGRFGRAQSPDPRLSVDDENPTIHAATGFPMCVPRTDPAVADDALCPQANRPKPVNSQCRNFGQAGIPLPASGELSFPAAGQVYCSQYVMPNPATALAGEPDAKQQAPFEVGDFVAYSGTLMKDVAGNSYLSTHTIEANVGIYTQPGTQPSYLAIGGFGLGTADPAATAVNGAGQETQDRMFLEAETTDVQTPVDIYMMDTDPQTGAVKNRWITPFEMTGEAAGGITTQFTGPQPQRARIRATKAPAGLLSAPSRTVRVMARTLCQPLLQLDQTALDTCVNTAPIEANGLVAGQYSAPVFEYIFPENVKPGDPIVPNDFWHLPFLRSGEGAATLDGVGPLEPSPWGPELAPPPPAAPAGVVPPPPAAPPVAAPAAVAPAGAPAPGPIATAAITPAARAGARLTLLAPTVAGTPVAVAVTLATPALVVRLVVTNAAGKVVRIVTRGRTAKGRVRLIWNGRNARGAKVIKGLYRLTVTATPKRGPTKTLLVRGIQINP